MNAGKYKIISPDKSNTLTPSKTLLLFGINLFDNLLEFLNAFEGILIKND